jgi:hypothetical protein
VRAETTLKEHIMNTTHNRKKSVIAAVGAAIAAAAVPAFLFTGAGTAQAHTIISTKTDPFGVTVHIQSTGVPASSGWCTYTAVPNGPGVPVYGVPFYLQDLGSQDLWFPGIKTGTTWQVTVHCQNGIDSGPDQVVY